MALRLAISASLMIALGGCAVARQPLIREFDHTDSLMNTNRQQRREDMMRRWSITVYEGYGIPGMPQDITIIPNAISVLQAIVNKCRLGQTNLIHMTDGVAELEILDPSLTPSQIQCARGKERPGLFLVPPRL